MQTIKAIKLWYRGKPAKDRYTEVVNAGYEPHWTARCVKAIGQYIRKEYKWLVPVTVSSVALAVKLMAI